MLYGKGVFVLSWGDGVWYGQEEAFINKNERGTHNGGGEKQGDIKNEIKENPLSDEV